MEVLGGEDVVVVEGVATSGESVCFSTLPPFPAITPPPLSFYARWRKNEVP